jgi:hypothetical protein
VEAFLRERGGSEAPVASRAELGVPASELNTLWWREVERILGRMSPERALVTPEERLLVDHGVLDWRLVPGGDRLRAAQLRELYAEARPRRFYFSEWILERLRHHALVGVLDPAAEHASSTRILRGLRERLYFRLSPFFKALPGFNPQAIQLFLSGRIDESLDALGARLQQGPDEASFAHHRQLQEIRSRLIARARDRARLPDDLALFDALRDLDRDTLEKHVSRGRGAADARGARTLSDEERLRWLQDELRFVKQVLWLGIMGSGLARTYSVLFSSQPRLDKAAVDPILALARTCDPGLAEPASILIAPYSGGGFYEWDRDTLFLPLVPTREPEHAVVQGLANYRILLDTFQESGAFKKEYEAAFGAGEDFAASYLRDYRAWILGVGRGYKGALDPARFAFFRDRLGPSLDVLYAPREWVGATPKEQEDLVRAARGRLSDGASSFEDHSIVAIAAWRGRQAVAAIQHLQAALRLQPVDGRSLLAVGVLSARIGGKETARLKLQECMSAAPGTLWSVYAADELQRL